jgi:RNA polymerase sigma-70 factor, ECF subfamily
MDVIELIGRCRHGDRQAWNMIINAYSRSVYNIALNFIGDKDTASDITQDIFIKLYQNLDKFKDNNNFSSWLFTLSRNYCIDYWRKNKRYLQAQEIDEQAAAPGDSPEEEAVRNSETARLRQAILLLEPEARLFLILRDILNLSYQEIAEKLGVPEGTVKSRINRGRLKLSQLITKKEE